jgi:para-nitrobenzyl esterase
MNITSPRKASRWMQGAGAKLLLGIVSAWALGAGHAASAVAVSGPVVFTRNGPYLGIATGTMDKFLGIRYAAPPTGNLRWKPPQPPETSFAVRDATQFANHCPQPSNGFLIPSVTEDCLFLNVFTPPSPFAEQGVRSFSPLRPVMLWLYGGALVFGESDDYDPQRLVAQGVIVVTINYRVGALGYLAHPALADAQGAAGNYGLMDQQSALAWVKRNIIFFGGDPDNVTLFGESAGGFSTLNNLVSPKARGLFQRAIIESGAYQLQLPSLATAEAQGGEFATVAGCPNQTATCLRSLSVEQILAHENVAAYTTNIDGKFLTQSIGTALATGEFNHMPVINGTNHDEGRLFVALSDVLTGNIPTPANYAPLVAATVGMSDPQAIAAIVSLYPPGTTTLSAELALGAVGTDATFACPAHFADELMSRFVPTFAYEFNDENAPTGPIPFLGFPYGAYHAAEVLYFLDEPSVPVTFTPDQQQLAAFMVDYWSEFAARGNPNRPGAPVWRPFIAASDDMQSLVPPTPVTEFNFATAHNCAFWDALSGRTLPRDPRFSSPPE